ncbi:MAG TPA: hypothetical protein VGN69_05990 [Solirubrobacteraceae bacterium]|nr:hypothetical protein [Solirubrobacteraceae bacterium]
MRHRPPAAVKAFEDGIEPEVVTARIAELKSDKEEALLTQRLARIPDLTQALRDASPEVKRQAFDAFGLRIEFDKAQRRIEIAPFDVIASQG